MSDDDPKRGSGPVSVLSPPTPPKAIVAEPRRPKPVHERFKPQPMVEWFHPYRLLVTGLQVLVWEFVGQSRPMEERPRSFAIHEEFATDRNELWFDFIADVGDGWDSTYTMASLVAQPHLEIDGKVLPRGEFLLFGGDEVYPVPSQRSYLERFVAPYEAALPPGSTSVMFAIPGNHDWYDGLVSFSRQFTQHLPIGQWVTKQNQTYFAIQLPQRWWLWALDVLPKTEMDFGQRSYFENAADELDPGDRVILVSAVPEWISVPIDQPDESHTVRMQALIADKKATVHLWLAGDLHHYRRHELVDPDGSANPAFQRISSGGGGAYLSPTHRPAHRRVVVRTGVEDQQFDRKAAYPNSVTSLRLSFMNLFFAVKNWKLGVNLLGIVYLMLTWTTRPADWPAPASWLEILKSPGLLFWLLVILGGFVVYADNRHRGFQWIGGLAHGVGHVLVAMWATGMINRTFLEGGAGVTDYFAATLLNFVAGAVLGPTVLGLYLFVAINFFGRHADHAFSSLRIPHYKHFLRLHVREDGQLEVYPIGVRRVPKGGAGRASYTLLEGPVVIDPLRTSKTRAGGWAAAAPAEAAPSPGEAPPTT